MNAQTAIFTSHYECRVYVELTDMFGVVYHAHYFNLFERARTEMLREHGFNVADMAKKHLFFGIRDATIKYYLPARLDDILRIETRFIKGHGARMVFEQTMQNAHNMRVCELAVTVVCVDAQFQPIRIPKPMQEYIDRHKGE